MDIIGNLYIDFFTENHIFDGKSYLLDEFTLGGFINLFENNFLKELNSDTNFFCISEKNEYEKYVEPNLSKLNLNIFNIINSQPSPKAIIFEYKNERTSYVLFDKQIEIDLFNNKSENIIIYYGDKIKIKKFKNKTKQIFVDTAGNKVDDLKLSYNVYPKNTIISISSEYLTSEIKERYLELEFIIISHNPIFVEIIGNKIYKKIENEFLIRPEELKYKITGIGDKFFYLFSLNYAEKNLNLYDSVVCAQKKLNSVIKNNNKI